jgi:Na+/proline symporter
LVILVGCVVLGIAAYLFNKAYRATFTRNLNLSTLNGNTRKGVITLGRLGHAALGIVFTIIGFFLVIAAVKHNPGDAKGLDTALIELLNQPFGPWLLGIVALGLLAYGIYSFAEARYRRVG